MSPVADHLACLDRSLTFWAGLLRAIEKAVQNLLATIGATTHTC